MVELDISSLFVTNDGKNDDNSEGSLLASNPGYNMNVVADDGDIIFEFSFAEYFNEDNYTDARIFVHPKDASDKYIYWKAPSRGDHYYLYGSADEDMFEEYLGSNSDGSYTVYGCACTTDEEMILFSTTPTTFWFSVPYVESLERGDGYLKIAVYDLEQEYSKNSPNKLVLATKLIGNNPKVGVINPYMQTISRDFTIHIGGVTNEAGSYYLYELTQFGNYYLIDKISYNAYEEEIDEPSCTLSCTFIDKPYSYDNDRVTGIIYDYPIINATDFNQFCRDINTVRVKADLSSYSFTNVSSNSPMTANIWKNVVNAIYDMRSSGKPSVNSNFKITPEFVKKIEQDLKSIRDTLSWK